jgi:hypothetical protein
LSDLREVDVVIVEDMVLVVQVFVI